MAKLTVIHRWLSYQGSVKEASPWRKSVFTQLTILNEPATWTYLTVFAIICLRSICIIFMLHYSQMLTIFDFPMGISMISHICAYTNWVLLVIYSGKWTINSYLLGMDFGQLWCGCLTEGNKHLGNNFTGWCLTYGDGALMQWQFIVKMVGNVSDWLSVAGGALKEVADWAGLTVLIQEQVVGLHGLPRPACPKI